MDTIDIECVEGTYSDGTVWVQINLILNGEVIKGVFDPFEFAIPTQKRGAWFLMTCGCGVSECAGYYSGIYVKRRRKTVEWRDMEIGKDTFPKRFYSFDINQYNNIQAKCLGYINYHTIVNEESGRLNEDRYDGSLTTYTVDDLKAIINFYNRPDTQKNRENMVLTSLDSW